MHVLLIVLGVMLAFALLCALATVAIVLLGLRSLRRRNRVSPGQPSDAPLQWLASPAVGARLHRRLRAAVDLSQLIANRHAGEPVQSAVADLAANLESQAVALDRHLIAVAHLSSSERRRLLVPVGQQVNEIELLASRLSLLDAQDQVPSQLAGQPSATAELAQRLDHMEAARRELDAMEAGTGLERPGPLGSAPEGISRRP